MASRLVLVLNKLNRNLLSQTHLKSNLNSFISIKAFSCSVVASHVASRRFLVSCGNNQTGSLFANSKTSKIVNPYGLRFNSDYKFDEFMDSSFDASKAIPDVGIFQEVTQQVAEVASFKSLGLCHNTPPGLLESLFEYCTVDLSIPWISAILGITLVARAIIFPFAVIGLKNSIQLSNIKPQMDKIQQEMKAANNTVGSQGFAVGMQKLKNLYAANNCSIKKGLILPAVQMPTMISFFIAIRHMANLPVESLKTGGIAWFPDLTIADPYFILPVTCVTLMVLLLEVGGEAGTQTPQMQQFKSFFRLMSVFSFGFLMYFPAGLQFYWVVTNAISLLQGLVFQSALFQKMFNIPKKVIHPHESTRPLSFSEMFDKTRDFFMESQEKAKIKQWDKQRKQRKAGFTGSPIQPTYDSNPQARINEELFQEERIRMSMSNNSKNKKRNKKKRRDYLGPRM